ncbi:unnamed protein product [Ilex paraguariensis]|uniref:Uncharacterized protein n=1 Tax=Ilex paraguariensis TaxID=185542 RepID=A0ABC8TKX5_9AQUA
MVTVVPEDNIFPLTQNFSQGKSYLLVNPPQREHQWPNQPSCSHPHALTQRRARDSILDMKDVIRHRRNERLTEKYLLRALLGKDSTQGLLNRKKRDNGSSTVEGVGTSEGVKHNGRCRASQKTLSTV